MKNKIITLLLFSVISFSASAQLKVPVASPLQTLKQNFALSDITIEYSRPGVKGRVIFGELIPFGKIWRTGANASTKITFGEDVKIEGNPVAAGTYAIYTIPDKDTWEIILYTDLKLGGNVADFKPENALVRFKVKSSELCYKEETFTINIADITATSANVELTWEKTRVAFNVTADIDEKVMKNIDTELSADKRPYFQAAAYYYDNNKDLNKALEWVNKAVEQNPAFFVLHLKAKIQMKLKDYKGAIATAEQSLTKAREAKNEDYIKMNEKLIAEAKKGK